MIGLHPESLFAAGYAVFLVACALGLDRVARHSHRRSARFRTAGFDYHPHLDAWRCPEGEHLRLAEVDRARRVARYRARAHVCNACRAKEACTDSDEGREIAQALDPWPHSEAGRFHRGISVVLVVLAGVATLVGMALRPDPAGLALLGGVLVIVVAVLVRLTAAFRATPTGFPDGARLPEPTPHL